MAHADSTDGIDFTTPLLCQELWNGELQVSAVADPTVAVHGASLAACLSELRLFLEDFLGSAPPEVLAQYALPAGTRIEELEVDAPRPDLPKRLAIPGPIQMACVVVPFAEESWVFIPALEHTLRLSPKDDLLAAVRAEAERVIVAREPSAEEYLRLLPPKSQALERLALRLKRTDLLEPGKAKLARAAQVKKEQRALAREILASVAVPLHERDEARAGPRVIGREAELKQLGALLGGKERLGVLLLGPELSGKTALLYAWLREERRAGRERLVWATSGSRLIAGMSGFGQWQERVQRVMKAAEDLDAVLCFENLGELLAQHATESLDIPGALKPFLEDKKVRFLGELAPESLDLLEARHGAFFATLSRLRVEPLAAAPTADALRERIAWFAERESGSANVSPAAVGPLLDLAERYLPYRSLPGKAVRLFDELRAAHRNDRSPDGAPRALGPEQVFSLFSLKTGIPELLLREDRSLDAAQVEGFFRSQLVGQETAVRRVVEVLCGVKAGLQPAGKPLATFLFVGPTGVGKTELARLVAAYLFGSPERMFRFDMSEFMDPWAAERLIRGTDRAEGLLTRRVRQQPFCVLLLDEIEKADSAVFDLLLQVCGEGRLTDARGRTAYFNNALIILTSNLGASRRTAPLGIGAAERDEADHYLHEAQHHFRPELLNRIDQIVAFHPLTPAQASEVAWLALGRIRERRGFLSIGATLSVEDAVLERLAREGYHRAFGARALRRHLEASLVTPIARLLAGSDARSGAIRAFPGPEGLQLQLERPTASQSRNDLDAVRELQRERERADRNLILEPVEQLREHLAFLVAQLAQGPGDSADKPRGRAGSSRSQAGSASRSAVGSALQSTVGSAFQSTVGSAFQSTVGSAFQSTVGSAFQSLHGEYQRLHDLWVEAEGFQQGLHAAEELALLSLFSKEDPLPFVEEGKRLAGQLYRLMPYLLLAMQPRRDEITLLVQEADAGRGFDHWLSSMLDEAARRRWTVQGHAGLAPAEGKKRRRWNPPLEHEDFAAALDSPDRDFRCALVHVRGRYAGVLLGLEAGLHRFRKVSREVDPVHVIVDAIAMRSSLTDKELASASLTPSPIPPARELGLHPATCEHLPDDVLAVRCQRTQRSFPSADRWRRLDELTMEHLLCLEQTGGLEAAAPFSLPLDRVQEASAK